jgi:hypothetical protein
MLPIYNIDAHQIKEVNSNTLEDVLSRLIILLTKGQYVIPIILFLKTLIITLKLELKLVTLQNIKDILLYVSSSKQQFNLKEDEMADINLILSHTNNILNNGKNNMSRLQPQKNNQNAYSHIINSFASNSNI